MGARIRGFSARIESVVRGRGFSARIEIVGALERGVSCDGAGRFAAADFCAAGLVGTDFATGDFFAAGLAGTDFATGDFFAAAFAGAAFAVLPVATGWFARAIGFAEVAELFAFVFCFERAISWAIQGLLAPHR